MINWLTSYTTPSACFIPPRQVGLKEKSGPHFISIPFFIEYEKDGVLNKTVSFDTSSSVESVGDIVDFASILEVMFVLNRYPRIEENELFCIRCVVINREKEEIVIIGHIFYK
jgi:hypothetical protein